MHDIKQRWKLNKSSSGKAYIANLQCLINCQLILNFRNSYWVPGYPKLFNWILLTKKDTYKGVGSFPKHNFPNSNFTNHSFPQYQLTLGQVVTGNIFDRENVVGEITSLGNCCRGHCLGEVGVGNYP